MSDPFEPTPPAEPPAPINPVGPTAPASTQNGAEFPAASLDPPVLNMDAQQLSPIFAPVRFGQVLERIWQLLRFQTGVFVQIALLPLGVIALFYVLMLAGFLTLMPGAFQKNAPPPDPTVLVTLVAVAVLGTVPILMIMALYEAALAYTALRLNAGQPVTAREAWQCAWERMGRYLRLMFLRTALAMIPFVALAILVGVGVGAGALISSASSRQLGMLVAFPIIGLGYIASLVGVLLVILWLSFSYSVSVTEDLPAWASICRSYRLTKGIRGRIFLAMLVIYAISYVGILLLEALLLVVVLIGSLVVHLLPLSQFLGMIGLVLAGLVLLTVGVLFMALTMAAYSTAFCIYYQDQRRREDFYLHRFAPEPGSLPDPPLNC